MAGFLRKKSKQEPQGKGKERVGVGVRPGTAPSSINANANAGAGPASTPTPLFARFASTAQQEPPRTAVVSSPMVLVSGSRRGGGGSAGAGAGGYGRNRGVESFVGAGGGGMQDMQRQRMGMASVEPRLHQGLVGQRLQERQELRPGQGQAQWQPQSFRQEQRQDVNGYSYGNGNGIGIGKARPVSRVPMFDKPLPPSVPNHSIQPDPTISSTTTSTSFITSNAGFESGRMPEFADEQSWATTTTTTTSPDVHEKPLPQPRNTSMITSPNASPRRLMSVQTHRASVTNGHPSSRVQNFHSRPHVQESDVDADRSTRESLTPQASYRDLQKDDRSDFRGKGNGSAGEDEGMAREYKALLEVVFGDERHSESSLPMDDRGLPDSSLVQEIEPPIPSPNAKRKSLKVPVRSSTGYVESPVPVAQRQPLPVKPDNRRSYQPPPPPNNNNNNNNNNNMGANISSFDVSSYKSHHSPSPPRSQKQSLPPRTASMSIRSVNPPPPPVPGKPLIFAAMAAIDQQEDKKSIAIEQVSNFSQQQQPQNAYPSPPQEFSFPPKQANGNSHTRNPSLGIFKTDSLPALPVQNQRPSFPQPSSSPPKHHHASHMVGPRPPPDPQPELQPRPHPSMRQSPTRVRKLSKARNPAQESSDFSIHSHSSSVSVSHRSPGKTRPVTPVSVATGGGGVAKAVIEDDGVGVPLDDDPFAKVEGVRMLKPTSSRAGSPEKEKVEGKEKEKEKEEDKDATIRRRRRSKGQLSRDETNEEFHSASEGESLHPSQRSRTPLDPSPTSDPARPRTTSTLTSTSTHSHPQQPLDQIDRLTPFLASPPLLTTLLGYLSFYEWCMLLSLSRDIRFTLVQNPELREAVLERFLKTVGYMRWVWDGDDPVSLSLQDLSDYMRGVSTPTHEYSRVSSLYVHSLSIHPSHRDTSLLETVNQLSAATRAYTRVVLRLRAQAEKEASLRGRGAGGGGGGGGRGGSRPPSRAPSPTMSSTFSHSNHGYSSSSPPPPPPISRSAALALAAASTTTTTTPSPTPSTTPNGVSVFSSPLFKLRRAPLLRVFVPSPEGDWLSDKNVLECEAECRKAGVGALMRVGDVVWDVAVGDEGNLGRLVWDGSYLLDLDYTYTPIGDLPKYMPTLAFPPSYFHRVIRTGTGPTSSNPIAHIDLRPWGEEVEMNLQLLQERVRTETPQGTYHNLVRWVHRSSFIIRPPPRSSSSSSIRYPSHPTHPHPHPHPHTHVPGRIPIPDSNGLYVDPGWYGTIVVETEGTNEALRDLKERCGGGGFSPRARGVAGGGNHNLQGMGMGGVGGKEGMGMGIGKERERKVFRILREKSRPGEIWIRTVFAKERLL